MSFIDRMPTNQVLLFDSDGNPMAVQNGVAIPASTSALLLAGSDGTNSRYLKLDASGRPDVNILSSITLTTIDTAHAKVHAGAHYFVQNWQPVSGAGTVLDVLVDCQSAAVSAHMMWSFHTGAAFTVEVFEGAAVSAAGSSCPARNSNRGSANVATVVVTHGPTVTDAGTSIVREQISAGGKSGGDASREEEIILARSTKYLLRFTKTDAGEDFIHYDLFWYEV